MPSIALELATDLKISFRRTAASRRYRFVEASFALMPLLYAFPVATCGAFVARYPVARHFMWRDISNRAGYIHAPSE